MKLLREGTQEFLIRTRTLGLICVFMGSKCEETLRRRDCADRQGLPGMAGDILFKCSVARSFCVVIWDDKVFQGRLDLSRRLRFYLNRLSFQTRPPFGSRTPLFSQN